MEACDKPHYPYELPEGWVWTTLGEITSIIGDGLHGTPQYDIFGNYFFINGNNLVNRTIVIKEGTKKVSDDEYVKYRKPLNERTILVSINGTIGNVGTYNGEKIILGKSACYFNLLPDISKSYICNIIESDYFRKYAFKSATGSTIKNVPLKAINDFYIPLPPLQEQMRIVESIEHRLSFVGYIELDKEILQETIKKAKSKILDLAIHGKLVPQDPTDEPASELLKRINPKAEIACDNGQYGKLPKGWCETILGSIGTWQSGATPSRLRKDYYGGNIPWLKTGDLNDGIIEFIPECITERALEETSVKLNPTGSILIAMYGATIGKIGILSKPATTNQACCACINYLADKMFLFYFLFGNKEKFIAMGGGGAQPNISKEKIIHTHIPLPPLSEQHRIVAKIEELFAQLDNIAAAL